jgi:predicted phosphate transport protein (TIGR00153 family)
MALRLLPRDERFFDLFAKVATLNVEAARVLGELFATNDAARRVALVEEIKRYEHDADELTHAVVARLDRSFITPLDREDIHLLASRLDDVIDLIDGIARRSQIFRIGSAPQGAILLAGVIQRAAAELLKAVQVMDRGRVMTVFDSCREVKRLEEEGDALYHEWLGRLFDDVQDPVNVIKWKELYDTLERTLDSAEDVANVLESVSIKHG